MITYKATNTRNGKFYIGSTTNFERRKKYHESCYDNYPFQNALRKDPDAFVWETIEDDSTEPILEQALLDMWFGKECCYNLNPSASRPPCHRGVDSPMYGKTGDAHPAFGKPIWNNGTREKRSVESPGEGWEKGRLPVSDEARMNQSKAGKGKPKSKAFKEKVSGEGNGNYGKRGGRNHCAKAIMVIHPDGSETYFPSGIEAALEYGLDPSGIGKVLKGKRKTHKGLKFRYAEPGDNGVGNG